MNPRARVSRPLLTCLALAVLAHLAACHTRPADPPGSPLIIAHRGASAYLPEHTLPAYALAHGQGADVIEPDVVLTRDAVPICAHDLHADTTTNAKALYPDRARPDGHVYYADLTLAEVRTLTVTGRGDRAIPADAARPFAICTLDEMIALVQTLNARTGRRAGIVPEAKDPSFHRERGLPLEAALVRTLHARGYATDGCEIGGATIQSFDPDALQRIRSDHACALPLVYLCRADYDPPAIERLAPILQGVGFPRGVIEKPPAPSADTPPREAPLALARRLGLKVYMYTFADAPDAYAQFFRAHPIDALFADNPDVAIAARNARR